MHKSPLAEPPASMPSLVPVRKGFTSRRSAKVLIVAAVGVCLTALWVSPVSQAVEKSESQGVLADDGFQNVLKGHSFSRAAVPLPCFCHSMGALAPMESAFAASSASLVAQERPPVTTEPTDQPSAQPFDLSDEVVRDVLTNLQRGVEAHDLDRVLEIFDQQNMKDYAQFHDQMVAFFRRYDSVKFRYQLLQVTSDKEGGFAIADIDMDADPTDILPTPQRRSTQMRFQMKRTPKGWKVVALRPADFFNQ